MYIVKLTLIEKCARFCNHKCFLFRHFDPRALEANLTLLDPDNKLGRENMTMQDKLKVFARAKKNEANNSAVPASNSPGKS